MGIKGESEGDQMGIKTPLICGSEKVEGEAFAMVSVC
jgi:hypothetical protein